MRWIKTHIFSEKEEGELKVPKNEQGYIPVSYTHLDVYKRQFVSVFVTVNFFN